MSPEAKSLSDDQFGDKEPANGSRPSEPIQHSVRNRYSTHFSDDLLATRFGIFELRIFNVHNNINNFSKMNYFNRHTIKIILIPNELILIIVII